jgi:hypothetical protein
LPSFFPAACAGEATRRARAAATQKRGTLTIDLQEKGRRPSG